MIPYSLKIGQIIGREHLFYARNCQDALRAKTVTIHGTEYIIAFVCDGCSKGKFSEVGAGLAADYLMRQTIDLLRSEIPLEVIPYFLHQDLLDFLRSLLESQPFLDPAEESRYINDHLLFSVVGIILTAEKGIILAQGDGFVLIDDLIDFRDYDDYPPYISYLLVNQKYLEADHSQINDHFDVYSIDTTIARKIAIGSDSWAHEKDQISKLWGHQHPNQIQRLLNLWSDKDKKFGDDTTIVVLEKEGG